MPKCAIARVSNDHIVVRIYSEAIGNIKSRGIPQPVIGTRDTWTPRKGAHQSCGRDLADGIIGLIADIKIGRRIRDHPPRAVKPCSHSSAISSTCHSRRTSQGCNYPSRIDFANGVITSIRNIDIATSIKCSRAWEIEPSFAPRTIGTPTDVKFSIDGYSGFVG